MIPAGIITFNPEISRLRENIDAILPQVGTVVLFDNGSSNIADIEKTFGGRCTILKSPVNIGIASALNEICRYFLSNGHDWVFTLDDDSVCPSDLISEFEKHIDKASVGILSPRIYDRNIGDVDNTSPEEYDEIDACITSASLVNLAAWKAVGGFWDELFIDMVDFDICWSLREKGYKIIRINSVSLLHELGHSTPASFRGNPVAVLNHSPLRYYYIFRNTIAVGHKHQRKWQCFRWNFKRLYLILRYENNRPAKINYITRGIFDGIIGRLGKYCHNC